MTPSHLGMHMLYLLRPILFVMYRPEMSAGASSNRIVHLSDLSKICILIHLAMCMFATKPWHYCDHALSVVYVSQFGLLRNL